METRLPLSQGVVSGTMEGYRVFHAGASLPQASIELSGPHRAWHGAARQGHLVHADGLRVRALVLLGPKDAKPDALKRALSDASAALRWRNAGVLTLEDVVRHQDRVVWVHSYFAGISLGHTVGDSGPLLSVRAGVEVVAQVAEVFRVLGAEAYEHNGPEPSDLLLGISGQLKIAAFASPFPRAPSMRPPMGNSGEAALVFRLGVLLAWLVGGQAAGLVTDETSHDSYVRRALINAMARPGPVVTDKFGDWLRGMLAWNPGDRPALANIPAGLRKEAIEIGGPSLMEWAAANVDDLRHRADYAGSGTRPVASPGTDTTQAIRKIDLSDEDTEGVDLFSTLPNENAPTVAEPEVPPTVVGDHTPPAAQDQPSRPPMPVHIGPAPHVVKRQQAQQTVDLGDVDPASQTEAANVEVTEDWDRETTGTAEAPTGASPLRLLLPLLWVFSMVVLTGCALVVLLVLMLWDSGPDAGEGPSLDEVMLPARD